VRLKSAAVWVTPLVVVGLLDSSCIFSAGDHDSGVRRRRDLEG
jgi:hypothetical protein